MSSTNDESSAAPENVPPAGGEEPLPWLQRVEEEAPKRPGLGGKVGCVAAAIALFLAAMAALAYLLSHRPVAPPEPATGNESLNQALPPNMTDAVPDRHRGGKHHKGRHGERSPERNAPSHAPERAAPVPAPAPTPAPRPAPRAEPRPEPRPAPRVEPRPHPRAETRPAARAETRRHGERSVAEPRTVLRGPVVQVGAYDSRALAERAWKSFAHGRTGAAHSIERARVGGRIYYRLRIQAPGGGCRQISRSIRRCFVVGRGR